MGGLPTNTFPDYCIKHIQALVSCIPSISSRRTISHTPTDPGLSAASLNIFIISTASLAHATQMLGQVEGLFASRILQIDFCHGSADDARSGATVPEGGPPVAHSERLLCVGCNGNGTLTIKGLALPSLREAFSVHLTEAPTCVRVASRRPLLAIGYGDGTVQTVEFRGDRYDDTQITTGSPDACFWRVRPPHSFRGLKGCSDSLKASTLPSLLALSPLV